MDKTIFVGDVHGCLEEFQALIRSVYRPGDRVILVGDLVDKGPDPVGCVQFARKSGFDMVLGNHEHKHLRYRKHELARKNSGKKQPPRNPVQLSAEYAVHNAQLTDDDIRWMTSLPLMLTPFPGLVVVHAGLEPSRSVNQQSESVIRVRFVDSDGDMIGFKHGSLEQPENTTFWSKVWKGPESVIYGHAYTEDFLPRVDQFNGGACYGIDTGCVYGGRLTAAIFADGQFAEFVHVPANRVYHNA